MFDQEFSLSFSPSLWAADSTKGIKRLSQTERARVSIPEEKKDVLVGILLGDGHISKRTPTSNSRFMYSQTAVKHKEYFNHVYNIFKLYCVEGATPKTKIILDKRTNKKSSSISFATMQLPCFNWFKEIFYDLNVKIVPNDIYNLLTPRGLAF
jgi:hypothetical protein